jgi:phenylalanine-4-hydroxylase
MRTRYRIDRFQETYFVIDDFAQLSGEISEVRSSLSNIASDE